MKRPTTAATNLVLRHDHLEQRSELWFEEKKEEKRCSILTTKRPETRIDRKMINSSLANFPPKWAFNDSAEFSFIRQVAIISIEEAPFNFTPEIESD